MRRIPVDLGPDADPRSTRRAVFVVAFALITTTLTVVTTWLALFDPDAIVTACLWVATATGGGILVCTVVLLCRPIRERGKLPA